jgi:hypothetical protein
MKNTATPIIERNMVTHWQNLTKRRLDIFYVRLA